MQLKKLVLSSIVSLFLTPFLTADNQEVAGRFLTQYEIVKEKLELIEALKDLGGANITIAAMLESRLAPLLQTAEKIYAKFEERDFQNNPVLANVMMKFDEVYGKHRELLALIDQFIDKVNQIYLS